MTGLDGGHILGTGTRWSGVYSNSVRRFATVAVLLIGPAAVAAQALDDVEFQIGVTRNPPVFRIGERIDLELRFSTRASGKYKITTGSPTRFAPTGENYSVSPADGVVDPSENELRFGIFGSFLSGIGPLTDTPVVLHADLNERFRFTRPGTYVIMASSTRVSLQEDGDGLPFPQPLADARGSVSLTVQTVRSTPLELNIVAADASWYGSQLQEITAIFDSGANSNEKIEAAHRLAYLDTEAAAVEMARRYLSGKESEPWGSELHRGLLQTSFSAAAMPILEASLKDNRELVRTDVIQLLARMAASQEFRGKFPPPPGAGERASQAFTDAVSAYSKRINELTAAYAHQVEASLPRRSGKARASATFAAWQSLEMLLQPDADTPSANLSRLRYEVAAAAADLTLDQQQQLLGFFGSQLPSVLLLPFVRGVATGEIAADPSLREQAFKRWCEVAEPDCEDDLISEIQKPATDLRITTLLLLPMKDHPELDAVLTARLRSNPAQASALIARYGSPAILAAVRKALNGSAQANYCPVKENLLSYLLRVAPDEGTLAVSSALQQRTGDSCYMNMLESIARVNYTPALGRLAEKAVSDDPDTAVAASAAQVLSEFGSLSAEQALWDRFESWSEKWRDRAAELRARLVGSDPFQSERNLEFQLANGIARGKAWKISAAQFVRLENLCVTASCKRLVENWRSSPGQ
ncbi:MAG TPA: hypothetical protein VIY49_37440 [Bryobacteraceae bacterium]